VISKDKNPDNSYEDFEEVLMTLRFLLDKYSIKSIMTFGGEPLLFTEITTKIHEISKQYGVEKRELITNGYFSNNEYSIYNVVNKIIESGVNEIMLSMDAFHQEKIPLQYVEIFIKNIIFAKFENIKIHPAWVVSQKCDNVYNQRTNEIIQKVSKYGIKISNGNIIVPSGLAKENLKSYYKKEDININKRCGEIAFTNSLKNIKSIRILPNGNINICRGLTIGNIFKEKIENIIKKYNPYTDTVMSMLLDGGIMKVYQYTEECGTKINVNDYYSPCDLCSDCIKAINNVKYLP
jgi:MoaA/NifB/PqqE/SkfB family radical SAM enzyme